MARADRADLPSSRAKYRLQGRQYPRLLRALGQGSRLRNHARRRQRDDRRPRAQARAHHADRSGARHRAKPGHRDAFDQRLCPHFPVRYAAWHALLHHWQRLVARRLRAILGPQRHRAHCPVRGALSATGACARYAGQRPRAQPRPDRSGADAARGLRGARAGRGGLELRAEPADAGRIHPPRSALVPGQHAVLALFAHTGLAVAIPLSARLRHPDVPRLPGLDRAVAGRQRGGRARTDAGGAQARHDHEVPWSLACRQFWPHTLIALAPVVLLALAAPSAIPYALLIAAGPLLSIPLSVVTASPALGRALIAVGLDRLPEETLPPPELRALKLPAIELSQA